MGLEEGDEIRLEEEIIIAASPDVSAITDIIFSGSDIARGGRCGRPHGAGAYRPSDGTPFTQTTADARAFCGACAAR